MFLTQKLLDVIFALDVSTPNWNTLNAKNIKIS
jgi:hypothetical protein